MSRSRFLGGPKRGRPRALTNAEVLGTLEEADTTLRFAELGAVPTGGKPAAMERFLRDGMGRWAEVVWQSGARTD